MTSQLSFLDAAPAPPADARAERMAEVAANELRQRVVDAIWKWPGRTAVQLVALDGSFNGEQFWASVPAAEAAGEVHSVQSKWFPGRAKE